MQRPLVLVTNDDGIDAVGIRAFVGALKHVGELLVVAPERKRSAAGMSLTFHKPLRIQQRSSHVGREYAVSGSPADCVLVAVKKLLRGKLPDVVASGINYGDNVTAQSLYASGTVAAALQGAIEGIPSVAFSLAIPNNHPPPEDRLTESYAAAAVHARKIVQWICVNGLPDGVDYLNVNFPLSVKKETRSRITSLGRLRYDNRVLSRRDPLGRSYHWLHGYMLKKRSFPKGTDVHAIFVEGRVSITPMRLSSSQKKTEPLLASLVDFLAKNP